MRHSSRSQRSPAWALSCEAVHRRERPLQSACRHLRGLRGFELRHSDLRNERGVGILCGLVDRLRAVQPVTRVVELGVLFLDPSDGLLDVQLLGRGALADKIEAQHIAGVYKIRRGLCLLELEEQRVELECVRSPRPQ